MITLSSAMGDGGPASAFFRCNAAMAIIQGPDMMPSLAPVLKRCTGYFQLTLICLKSLTSVLSDSLSTASPFFSVEPRIGPIDSARLRHG